MALFNKRLPYKHFWWIVILISTWVFWQHFDIQNNQKKNCHFAKNGVFDFSNINFEESDLQHLHGEVYFFWDTLLSKTPDSLTIDTKGIKTEFPKEWNNLEDENGKLGAFGYGTYYFKIMVPEAGDYGLKIKEIETAYDLTINGRQYRGSGKVGKSKNEMTPSWKRREIYIHTQNTEIEVLIRVSNFYHRKGGNSEVMHFGSQEKVSALKNKNVAFNQFVIGILLILFVYHLAFAVYQRNDKTQIIFSLLCFFMHLRMGTTGEKQLVEYLSFINWEIAVKIEYISLLAIPPFIIAFYRSLLPFEINKTFVRFSFYLSGIFTVFVCFTPARIYTHSITYIQYVIIIQAIILFILIFKSVLNGREFAKPLFSSFYFFNLFFINDYLAFNNFIESTYLLPVGMLIIIVAQAIVVSKKTANALTNIHLLSDKLSEQNATLEQTVEARTKKILNQKNKIQDQKIKIEEKASELSAKNKELININRFKQDLTHMLVHDLKSPLHNIIGFSAMETDINPYKKVINISGWNMQNLVNNILDVEKFEQTKMSLAIKTSNLSSIIKQAFEQTSFMILNKNIKFENNIALTHQLNLDPKVIERVFMNIFSNSAKHSKENDTIKVWAELINLETIDYVKINIHNTGEPIPSNKLSSIFKKYEQLHNASNSHSFSTGIGLTYCKIAIEAHGGKIGALSNGEVGATFWFTIPTNLPLSK